MEKFLRLLKTTLEVILVLGFLFFEELIWKKLALPVKNYISGLKILNSTQEKIMKLDAYPTLLVFLVPLGIAEVMGIYSGILVVSGSIISGAIMYALKVPVAGITFWIFSFTKEKLLTIDWFETLYNLLMRFLNFVKETEIYKSVKVKIADIKKRIKHMMPGQGGFSEEINHVYMGLKNIFKGAKAIDEDEVKENNTKEKETEMKEEDEFVDPVERIAEAHKGREIKPEESRRDKNPEKKDEPDMGSIKR